ncbi:unnamed protein product, partial [Pylaiella littoralis]
EVGEGSPRRRKSLEGKTTADWNPPQGERHHESTNIRDTMRPIRLQEGPVRNHLRLPDDVG